jgi:hypothetical protein
MPYDDALAERKGLARSERTIVKAACEEGKIYSQIVDLVMLRIAMHRDGAAQTLKHQAGASGTGNGRPA